MAVMTLRLSLAAAIAVVSIACSDGSGPPAAEPSGEYQLQMVGTSALPYRRSGPFIDGSYINLVSGSLKVLSRSRLRVSSVDHHMNRDGTLREELRDTVVFAYRRIDEMVELTFENQLGVSVDTLDMSDYLGHAALTARSMRYTRPGFPAPLITGALFVRP